MSRSIATKFALFSLGISLAAGGIHAREQEPPATFKAVVACLTIGDAGFRLNCFDQSVTAVEKAREAGDLIVIDRQQVDKAERGIFGLSLPSVSAIFRGGGDNPRGAEIKQIESTVVKANEAGYGKWVFTLDEGSSWATTEAIVGRAPKVGMPIVVKRASLGGYLLLAEGSRSVRVRRLN